MEPLNGTKPTAPETQKPTVPEMIRREVSKLRESLKQEICAELRAELRIEIMAEVRKEMHSQAPEEEKSQRSSEDTSPPEQEIHPSLGRKQSSRRVSIGLMDVDGLEFDRWEEVHLSDSIWDTALMVFIVYSTIMVPLRIAWDTPQGALGRSRQLASRP